MNITIVAWELLETGGINRVINGFQTGFAKLGHRVRTFYGSKNGRLRLSEEKHILMTKWYRAKSVNLGWNNTEQMAEYKRIVKLSDFVLFIHPCPHPTKSGAGSDRGWQDIYNVNKPVGIVFTDNLWDRLYPWITEILDGTQQLMYNNLNAQSDSMSRLDYSSHFIHYPMDFDEIKHFEERPMDVIWMPQWKKWKGIWQFIKQLSVKPDLFNTYLFNSGIEYYNLRKTDEWRKAIRYDYFIKQYHNRNSWVRYVGLVEPDKVNVPFAKSKVSVDLSGAFAKTFQAQVTCAMIESMMFGSVVAVSPATNEDSRSLIAGKDVAYSVDLDHIIESLEELVYDTKMRKTLKKRALNYAFDNNFDRIVAQSVIDIMGV